MGNHSSTKKIPTLCSSNDFTTREAIKCLSIGFYVQEVSYETLKKLTKNLRDTNNEASQVISKNNDNKCQNKEFNELVNEYIGNYSDTLRLCSALRNLQTTHEDQSEFLTTLEKIECQGNEKTLEELKKFKDAESALLEKLSSNLKSLSEHESQMKIKLESHNKIITKKCKSLHKWRRNTTAICIGTCAGVSVCAIVAAIVAVPPVAAALSAATTIPIGSVGERINAVWKKHETRLKNHQKVSYAMEEKVGIVIMDLKTIQKLIENLKAESITNVYNQ